MTRRSQQVTVPTTKPLNTSGIQSNVPGGVRRSTRLFTSSNTNGTSSSVKVSQYLNTRQSMSSVKSRIFSLRFPTCML